MKNVAYLLIAVFLVACGGSGTNSTYEKTIREYLIKGKSDDHNLKIVELSEQGKVTVADSIAYLTDEYKKDNEHFIKRLELAKEMSEELLSKAKKQADIDEYTANITRQDNHIDSLKNASPDNLNGYDKRNESDVLSVIVRCKYSFEIKGRSVAETFDFYLSPDGSKCYGKKGI